MSEKKIPKICLIDASGYIHRAYHALPPLSTSKGIPVNAVFGFTRMISKVLKTEAPDFVGVCFDTPEATFRHELLETYKGTRVEIDQALIDQLPVVEELTRNWGLPCLKMPGYEADDLIASVTKYAREKGWKVLILSGDKDILQLVEEGVLVRDEIRKRDFTSTMVKEKFGVMPNQLIDYFSLMGDKIDNVEGIPGVGEKTAAKILSTFSSLEKLYEGLSKGVGEILNKKLSDKLLENKERVFANRPLITLKQDVPLNLSEDLLLRKQPDKENLEKLLIRLEFRGDFFGLEGSVPLLGKKNQSRVVHTVLSEKDLENCVAELKKNSVLSYDFETSSLDVLTCTPVGLALSNKENEAWYIPLHHDYLGAPKQLSEKVVASALKSIFENKSTKICAQNMKFDNSILRRWNIFPQGFRFDPMVAAYSLDASLPSYGLKELAVRFLDEQMETYSHLVGSKKDHTIADVEVEKAASYAGADAEVVLRLTELFEKNLTDQNQRILFEGLEMPMVDVIEEMERNGVLVDADFLRSLGSRFEMEKKEIEKEVFQMAGETFLLNSPQQLSRILFQKLKLPIVKKTKTGYSTNEDVLRKLAPKHPICEKIINYRELAKLSSTYVDGLLEMIHPKTGRIHTSFHQTGTSTGRLSSSNPNLQNIPIRTSQGREIRRAFIADRNHVLLSADYSQIDLRSLAHMTQDPVLIDTFQKGGDIHTQTASEIFHVSPSEVNPEMRRRSKAINFGVVYGQQAWGLAQSLGVETEEAQDFIERYFKRYAKVKEWMERTLENARKFGYVQTLAGRKRTISEINSSNAQVRGFAERVAINTPIQGTSADIIKKAMIILQQVIHRNNWPVRMLIQVHDDLLFEIPKDQIEYLAPQLAGLMESAFELAVPLVVDMKKGTNWNEMEKINRSVVV